MENLLGVWGGLGAQRETRHPQRKCLEGNSKEQVRVRRGHWEGAAKGTMTG
jgi:hypothetical protein